MARAAVTKPYYNFVGGINSESTGVNFPENSAVDLLNINIDSNGSISRRLGIKREPVSGENLSGLSLHPTSPCQTYIWNNAGNTGVDVLVICQKLVLYFFKYDTNSTSTFTTLTDRFIGSYFMAGDIYRWDTIVSCTAHGPYLVAVTRGAYPKVFKYEDNAVHPTDSFSIETRDFAGVDDGVKVFQRLPALTNPYAYNLYNQGWKHPHLVTYFQSQTVYPEHSEIWHAGKDDNGNFSVSHLRAIGFGSSMAPKGAVIFDIFNDNRGYRAQLVGSTGAQVPDLADTWSNEFHVGCVASYAGRLFYGVDSYFKFSPRVYFSQLADTPNKFGKCYQQNDPTSEIYSDLLETDGGYVEIPDAGKIIRMEPIQGSLIVFCQNGIWKISGGSGSAFTATNISVDKISNVELSAYESVVSTETITLFWSEAAICALVYDENMNFAVMDLTENVLKTKMQHIFESLKEEYDAGRISSSSYRYDKSGLKLAVQGVYDDLNKKIYWLVYGPYPGAGRTEYDTILIFDTVLKCFMKYQVARHINASAIVALTPCKQNHISYIPDSSNQLVQNSRNVPKIKLLLASEYSSCFADFTDPEFVDDLSVDWSGSYKINYPSKALVSYDLIGDASRKKQITYLTTFFNRTEDGFIHEGGNSYRYRNPSSCFLNAYWDWSNGTDHRKVGPYQVYRLNAPFYIPSGVDDKFAFGKQIVTSKNKIRGTGRSVQFEFLSDGNKDFQLLGWSVEYTGDGIV